MEWNINQIKCEDSGSLSNVVTLAVSTFTDVIANKKGHKNHITFFPTASSDGFVEYENLSQNTVKNWVKNTESNFYALTASYEAEISNSIASQSRGDLPPLW